MSGMRDFHAGGDHRELAAPWPARDKLSAVGRCLRGAFPVEEDAEAARLLALLGGVSAPVRGEDSRG